MDTVGIDVGYGYTKAVANGTKTVVFPSIIGPAEDLDFDAGLANGEGLVIEHEGRTYFVAERAALQSRWQTRTLSRERVTTEEAKILFLSSLVKLFPKGTSEELSVMTGLPIAWLDDKERLVEAWTGSHAVKLPETNRRLKFDVSKVGVAPQAWGTLVREFATPDGKGFKDRQVFDGDVVVIDFGTLTINLLSFSRHEYIQSESASVDDGMARVLERLQREILRVHGRDMPLHEVDEVMRQGAVRVYGQPQPVHDLVKPVIDEITDNVISRANSLWDAKSKSRVLLTGGGAIALGKGFKDKYQHPATAIVHDAQTANVEGLLLWAKMKEHFGA